MTLHLTIEYKTNRTTANTYVNDACFSLNYATFC